MDKVKEFGEKDAFARHCGVEILEIGSGTAKGRLMLTSDHFNGMGSVHGGALFTLADAVFAAAANSHGYVAVAVNINISYLKPIEGGVLTAEAKENNARGRIGSYTVAIMDDSGATAALFEGLAYRKF